MRRPTSIALASLAMIALTLTPATADVVGANGVRSCPPGTYVSIYVTLGEWGDVDFYRSGRYSHTSRSGRTHVWRSTYSSMTWRIKAPTGIQVVYDTCTPMALVHRP